MEYTNKNIAHQRPNPLQTSDIPNRAVQKVMLAVVCKGTQWHHMNFTPKGAGGAHLRKHILFSNIFWALWTDEPPTDQWEGPKQPLHACSRQSQMESYFTCEDASLLCQDRAGSGIAKSSGEVCQVKWLTWKVELLWQMTVSRPSAVTLYLSQFPLPLFHPPKANKW